MRIAFLDVTTTVSFGGLQTAVWGLARELHDLGHAVTVYGGEGGVRPDLGGRAIEIRTFPFTPRDRVVNLGTRFRKLWERRTFARHARAAVASARHDWIVLTKPFDFFWPKLVPDARYAFLSGGTDFMIGDRAAAERIDVMLAPSHFNAWQVAARYRRFPKVIFNGVDTARFAPEAPTPRTRAELGLRDDEFVVALDSDDFGIEVDRAEFQPPLVALHRGGVARVVGRCEELGEACHRGFVLAEVAGGFAALLLQPVEQLGEVEGVTGADQFEEACERHRVADVRQRVALEERGTEVQIGELGHRVRARQALRLRGCARP